MKPLKRFLRRSRRDRRLLIQAAFWIVFIRISLYRVSFRAVYRMLAHNKRGEKTPAADETEVARIIWAVDAAGYYLLPDKPCLPKAIAAQRLLNRAGYASTLRIGFRCVEGETTGHAWLENQGCILIGQLPNLREYVVVSGLT